MKKNKGHPGRGVDAFYFTASEALQRLGGLSRKTVIASVTQEQSIYLLSFPPRCATSRLMVASLASGTLEPLVRHVPVFPEFRFAQVNIVTP